MSQYRLIFTNIGLSKKQNAELNNDYIEITQFAVGSGNIVSLLPTMTGLLQEEYRADINNVDTKNGVTIFDLIVPSSVGGFYIKEVALFDVDGDCICIGTVPITYKVNQDEGASKSIHLKVSTTSTNTENIVFNTDDSLVYATVNYVNNSVSTLRNEVFMELPKKLNILSNAVSATKIKMDIAGGTCLELFSNTPANHTSTKEVVNNADAPNMGWWFIQSIRHSNNSNLWGIQVAYGWESNKNMVYQRTVNNGVWSAWESLGFTRRMIIMYDGYANSIPAGWALCDGQNGTPPLADRFIVGIGNLYNLGYVGGRADAINVSHSHTAWTDVAPAHFHIFGMGRNFGNSKPGDTGFKDGPYGTVNSNGYQDSLSTDYSGAHGHGVGIGASGESGVNQNLPPYYALAYIMKL